MSKQTSHNIDTKAIILLTSIIDASADVIYIDKDGKETSAGNGAPQARLTLNTAEGEVKMALTSFDAIYKGFVKCWPVIKPVKDLVLTEEREYLKASRAEAREAEAAAKKAEREQEKADKAAAKEAAAKVKKEAADEAKRARDEKEAERKKTIEEGKAAALKLKERQAKEQEKAKAEKAKAAKAAKKK